MASRPAYDDKAGKADVARDVELEHDFDAMELGKGDLLSREHVDPVLNAKMHLVNNVRSCPCSSLHPS